MNKFFIVKFIKLNEVIYVNICEKCLEFNEFVFLDEVIYMNIYDGYFDVNDFR